MFPRAQWRKVANGRFSSLDIAEGLRTRPHLLDPAFLSKIHSLGKQLEEGDMTFGTVLFIGVSENDPLTILDGNHRLMAAMLGKQGSLQGLRFLCGLSPRMIDCCWYRTNLVTLFRYARNVLRLSAHNPDEELARILRSAC